MVERDTRKNMQSFLKENIEGRASRTNLHDKLVCSTDEDKSVVVIKALRYVLAKGEACTTWRHAPPGTLVGVRPQKITHGPVMRHLTGRVEGEATT